MATELTRTYSWATEAAAANPISSTKMDTADNEIVAAINRKVQIKASAPSNPVDGQTWIDISLDPPVMKIYDATNTQWVTGSQTALSSISGDGAGDTDLATAFSDFMSGCFITVNTAGAQIGVSAGSALIGGNLRSNSSQVNTNPGSDPDTADWLDVWLLADAEAATFTVSLVDSGTVPGGTSNPGTKGRLIGSVYHAGSGVYSKAIQYRPDGVYGWNFVNGAGSSNLTETVTHGVTFVDHPVFAHINFLGAKLASDPVNIGELIDTDVTMNGVYIHTLTTTTFKFQAQAAPSFTAGTRYGYSYALIGRYS